MRAVALAARRRISPAGGKPPARCWRRMSHPGTSIGACGGEPDLFAGADGAAAGERAVPTAVPRPARIHRARRTRRLPQGRGPVRAALQAAVAPARRPRLLSRMTDDDVVPRPRHGEDRAARRATRWRRSCASAKSPTRRAPLFVAWFEPEHHIVERDRAVLRAALRLHALVDPDAARERPLGHATNSFRPRRLEGATRRARTRSRITGARITPASSTQRGSRSACDEKRNAGALLEEHARERAHCAAGARGRAARDADDRSRAGSGTAAGADHSRQDEEGGGRRSVQRQARGATRSRRCARRRWAAGAARCGRTRRRPCSAKVRAKADVDVRGRTAGRSGRPCGAGRSSARRASCSTRRWRKRASIARAPMSPTL